MDSHPPTFRIAINRMAFVEKPDNPNWEQLNTSFENVEVGLMDLCNAIYTGHPFCPWMNGRRAADNFALAQHIGIDMDTGDERSDILTLERHPFVNAYAAVMYETPSHTFQAPRSRILFLLDEPITTAHGYKAAIQVVHNLFAGADPACVDAVRFFYGNGKLHRSGRHAGIWINDNADTVLPLAELRRLARIRAENARQDDQRQRSTWMQRAPTAKVTNADGQMTLNELRDSLSRVDAYSMGYDTWMKLVAAIRHIYGDAAFGVVKAWSDKPGEKPFSESKWNSFARSHPNPAGYGTIVQIIKEFGR